MKILFFSDIHGVPATLEKLFSYLPTLQPNRLVLLGDALYHGPRNDLPDGYAPKEVIAQLSELKNEILCVRGNCDTEVDQMVLEFPVLSEQALIFEQGRCFFLSHGHHHSPESLPPLNPGDVLINGHTHIYKAECVDGIHCLNDGSVSLPKGGNPRSYMVYEDGLFTIKELESGKTLLEYAL